MATPNYGFEKRQRELAKEQKKEEKLKAKAARKAQGLQGGPLDAEQHEADRADAEEGDGVARG